MKTPQQTILAIEHGPELPGHSSEEFAGFAVLGVSFESGHTLALRQFPRNTSGEAFTSVWMREPNGDWHFFSTNHPSESCAKYMLPAVADQVRIDVRWSDEQTLQVEVPAISLNWYVSFEDSRRSSAVSRLAGRIPARIKRTRPGAWFMGAIASSALVAGKLTLAGKSANGQQFTAQPDAVWHVSRSFASIHGYTFGEVIEAPEQYRFGDFRLPRRGLAMAGVAAFGPAPEAETKLYPFGAPA